MQSTEDLKNKDRFFKEEVLFQDTNLETLSAFPACLACPADV
jgi:hypothetical protein